MPLNDEALLVRNCIFSKRTKYPLQVAHKKYQINDCLREHDIDEVHFTNIKGCLNTISEDQLCVEHHQPIEECGCPDDKEESHKEYQLDADGLLSWWGNWVDHREIFKSNISLERDKETRYSTSVRYNGVKIELIIFLSADELERYNLSPENLEFGIAFLPPEYALDKDNVFLWYEPLEEGFKQTLRGKLDEYQYCIPAPFADISTDAGHRRPIRRAFEDYLRDHGYDPRRGISGEARVVHDFDIPVDKISLSAIKRDEVVTLCDCDRHDMWHWHRFNQGGIVDVEENNIIKHMLDEMDENIDKYQSLKSYQNTIKGLSTALGGLAVVISFATLVTNFQTASEYISNEIPIEIGSGPIAAGLLVFGTAVVIIFTLITISPFIRERFLFNWSIPNYDEQSRLFGLL